MEKVIKCCATCYNCEEHTCLAHSCGFEAHVSSMFGDKSHCKDYDGMSLEEVKEAWGTKADWVIEKKD